MAKEIEKQPALAEKMAALLEAEGASLQDVLNALGLKAVAKGADERPGTRVATQRAWLDATKELDEDEALAVKALPELIGSAKPIEVGEVPTQEKIDAIAAELKPLRKTQDVAKGRCDALRLFVFNGADAKFGEEEPGVFFSLKEGVKLERGIAEAKASADLAKLEELVDDKVWKSITDTKRVVNEDKLTKALAKGTVSMDLMGQIVQPPKKIARFTVKPIKPGEEVS